MSTKPVLVIVATGKTGSRVAARLEAKRLPVRRGSRNAAIPFDWEAPETWAPALSGAAYVTYFPDLAFPGAVEKLESLCETAKDVGVEHLVLLSGRGEHHARLGEEVVRNSGVHYTIVRAAWFAQNFSEGYLRDPVLAGVLPMPGGDTPEPIIDIDDIADVAVAALTEKGRRGQLHEVTGPRLMTFAEMAAALSQATGREIRHIPISFDDFHANVAQAGGDFVADVFTAIARETLDGRNAHLADGVQRALGRPRATSPTSPAPPPPRARGLPPPDDAPRHQKGSPMTLTRFEKLALGLSGVTALGIGAFILTAPHAFYAGYGIPLGDDVNLLSELRAPGAGLAAFGALMLTGIVRRAMSQAAIGAALTVFLAFPAGRVVGLVIDGMPSSGILGALALELALAGLCLLAFFHRLRARPSDSRALEAH